VTLQASDFRILVAQFVRILCANSVSHTWNIIFSKCRGRFAGHDNFAVDVTSEGGGSMKTKKVNANEIIVIDNGQTTAVAGNAPTAQLSGIDRSPPSMTVILPGQRVPPKQQVGAVDIRYGAWCSYSTRAVRRS
jgi:hypothetical protein